MKKQTKEENKLSLFRTNVFEGIKNVHQGDKASKQELLEYYSIGSSVLIKEEVKSSVLWSLKILAKFILFSVVGIIFSIIFIIVIHRLLPMFGWLDDMQLSKLETIAFSGAISSLITIAIGKIGRL